MNSTAFIRRAQPSEAGAIVRLVAEVARENRWIRTEFPFDVAERARRLEDGLTSGTIRTFISVNGGEIVGEASLFLTDEGAQLGMVVARAWRRHGVGRALLQAAIEDAENAKLRFIDLDVYEHNAVALALYTQTGFMDSGTRKFEERRNGERWSVISMRRSTGRGATEHVRTRAARRDDRLQLAQLQHQLWPDYPISDHDEHLGRLFEGTASTLPLAIFVAEREDGALVGFIEVGLRSHANDCDPQTPVGFIEGWYVAESYRRQGIGRKLVATAEDWARAQGCKEMASDTSSDNQASEHAHEALGYRIVGRNTDFRKTLRI